VAFFIWRLGLTSGPNFVVRRATPADADGILFIWQETADMLARGDSRYKLAPDAAALWRENLLSWVTQGDTAVFVSESLIKPGHVLGYIVGRLIDGEPTLQSARRGYVSDLAVDSHGKVSGIGRGLFDALKAWFRECGITQVEARVPSRHPVAQAFWRALGASELYEQMWLKLE
jgi:ribosomal protein S18 acetylase RimI-like enzyme